MLTGMPSILMDRSVPWSRLKPRRKYWLALPSPECWVTIRPGTTSSASPTREKGTALTSAPLIRTALAAVGCRAAAPSDEVPGVTAAGARGDRLVRANGGSVPRTTILRRFWPSDPPGRRCVGSGDSHRRKLARPRRRPLLRRGGEHQNGRRSRGGKYPQQHPTHRHAPACLLLQFESDFTTPQPGILTLAAQV